MSIALSLTVWSYLPDTKMPQRSTGVQPLLCPNSELLQTTPKSLLRRFQFNIFAGLCQQRRCSNFCTASPSLFRQSQIRIRVQGTDFQKRHDANMPGFSAGKQKCAVSLSFQSLIRTQLTKVTVRQKPRFNVTKSHTRQSQFALPGCCGEVYHLATVLQHENTPHKNDRASGRLSQKLLLNCLTKAKCRKLLRCDIPQLQVLCLPEILPGS